jgi:hypothetical protein
VLAFAAALVLLAIAAGSLAAAGALHVSFGAKKKARPTVGTELSLPAGANGIAAVVDGRLSVVVRGGFSLKVHASAAALSPHALYVAAGIGHSLVVMAPSGRIAWSHNAGGKVVAIAWRPDGLEIAYVVRRANRLALHLIYGNGKKDMTIDRTVRAVRPSWRADSLAVAYVGAGGKPIVYDLGHTTHTVIASVSPVDHLAFQPSGRALAIATPGTVTIGRKTVVHGNVEALGWLRGHLAVALEEGVTPPLVRTFSRAGRALGAFHSSGRVLAITSRFVVSTSRGQVVAGRTLILGLRPGQTARDIEIG